MSLRMNHLALREHHLLITFGKMSLENASSLWAVRFFYIERATYLHLVIYCGGGHACVTEGRGQLVGISFLLPPLWVPGSVGSRFSKCLCWQSRLNKPFSGPHQWSPRPPDYVSSKDTPGLGYRLPSSPGLFSLSRYHPVSFYFAPT